MTDAKNRRGPISASELMANLANDPEHVRRMAEDEATRQVRIQELRRSAEPVIRDLRAIGVNVDSLWQVRETADAYPKAIPVLVAHLQRGGYPDQIMESLGRALVVKQSRSVWGTLRELYLAAQGKGEREGLALALAESATPDLFDDVLVLLADESRGDSRIFFLKTVVRLNRKRGREVVLSLQDDERLGKEARFMAKRWK